MWYPGAIYHVMERGIRRQDIFNDEIDYQVFLIIMKRELERNGCKVHAYCLMTNHIHMLLETGDINIGKFMKQVAANYANYFNRKYSYHGHLFEGRYRSSLIEDDGYFLQTSRYIHLNPVKAEMVEHAEDYPWSSYRRMIHMSDDKITEVYKTQAYFGHNGALGYREFVEDIGHKYIFEEDEIKKSMGEDDLWLPW